MTRHFHLALAGLHDAARDGDLMRQRMWLRTMREVLVLWRVERGWEVWQ